MSTKQKLIKIVETVRDFLIQQGKPSSVEDACFYRNPLGLKCAVGCVIPDDIYTNSIENRSIEWLMGTIPSTSPDETQLEFRANFTEYLEKTFDICSFELKAAVKTLQQCQFIHDNCSPEVWLEQFEILSINILNENFV